MFFGYKDGDKQHGKIWSREDVYRILSEDPNGIRHMTKRSFNYSNMNFITVPCRHCFACQLNYSAEWATRIMLECQKYENNWFITLTYDDKHVPILDQINIDWEIQKKEGLTSPTEIYHEEEQLINDGTFKYSLYPDDVKTFINSLRKYFEKKGHTGIKYFYCGEYGSLERPHYHIIFMNLPLDPNQFYKCKVDPLHHKAHWKSHEIEHYWGKGFVDVAECEWSCVAYVARYCTKKLSKINDDKYETYYSQGRLPEYIRMSKGIGKDYFKEHKDEIYKYDEIIMKTVKGNNGNYKPPAAFDRWMKEENPGFMMKVKLSRQRAGERTEKLSQELSNYTDKKKLEMKAESVIQKSKMLVREM